MYEYLGQLYKIKNINLREIIFFQNTLKYFLNGHYMSLTLTQTELSMVILNCCGFIYVIHV